MMRRASYSLIAVLLGMVLCSGMVQIVSAYEIEAPTVQVEDTPLVPVPLKIASGSGMAAGSATPCDCGEDQIVVELPAEAVVKQALLYWYGALRENDDPDLTARIGSSGPDLQEVTGVKIGGPTHFFSEGGTPIYFTSFRADITTEILAGAWEMTGETSTVATYTLPIDLPFSEAETREEAAGLMIIYDDGTQDVQIEVREGLDLAFFKFASPLDTTVKQTFEFTASDEARDARVLLMIGSEGDDTRSCRRNDMKIDIGSEADGTTYTFGCCGSCFSAWWDSHNLPPALEEPLIVPRGVTELSAQVISVPVDEPPPGELGASLAWIAAAVAMPPAEISVNPTILLEREPMSWTYTISNPGPLALEHIVVWAGPNDPAVPESVVIDCNNQTTLAVGKSMTCTAQGSPAYHARTAWVYAEPVGGGLGTLDWIQPD